MAGKIGRPTNDSLPLKDSDLTSALAPSHRLEVSLDELEQTRADLREFYIQRGHVGDLEAKVEQVIGECIEGWSRCPKNFQARVDKKTQRVTKGWQHIEKFNDGRKRVDEKAQEASETSRKVLEEEGLEKRPASNYHKTLGGMVPDSIGGITVSDLVKAHALSDEERLWWKEREAQYRSDFEFNMSSDEALLQQVLTDELVLRRLRFAILDGKDIVALGTVLEKISDRIRANLYRLGITKEQRDKERTGKGGSVAEVSITLEDRLKSIKAMQNEEHRREVVNNILTKFTDVSANDLHNLAEELHFLRLKGLREPPNILPEDDDEYARLAEEARF